MADSGQTKNMIKTFILGGVGSYIVWEVIGGFIENTSGIAFVMLSLFRWLITAFVMIGAMNYI